MAYIVMIFCCFLLMPILTLSYFKPGRIHISKVYRYDTRTCDKKKTLNENVSASNKASIYQGKSLFTLVDSNIENVEKRSMPKNIYQFVQSVWKFSRPHTIIGSALSIISLFLFAGKDSKVWTQPLFLKTLYGSLVPALFMNLYITGLNQITDVDIDRVNKPYLPIASGELSMKSAILICALSLIISLVYAFNAAWPLKWTLLGSGILGTLYSMPPFRLKRYPLLAAFCILVVRGSLVNLGFILQAKTVFLRNSSQLGLLEACKKFPESVAVTLFYAVFGLVIALMKDVPDIEGDKRYNISSFSVKKGAKKMFRTSWHLLFGLLSSTSLAFFISTGMFTSLLNSSMENISAMQKVFRTTIAIIFALFSADVWKRASKINAELAGDVFSFYMHIWNIFYSCYLILPFCR